MHLQNQDGKYRITTTSIELERVLTIYKYMSEISSHFKYFFGIKRNQVALVLLIITWIAFFICCKYTT